MEGVRKPYAFIKDTYILKHASQSLEGEEFEWNDRPVHPVLKRWFRYNPTGRSIPREAFSNPRESAAHVVTKVLLRETGSVLCSVSGVSTLIGLRDVQIEKRSDTRRPDVTGIVEHCSPHWHLAGRTIHVEVHFANAVTDPDRVAELRALGDPVLEIHLPRKYLRDVDVPVDEPKLFQNLLRAILTYGNMAGKWIAAPETAPALDHVNAFTR